MVSGWKSVLETCLWSFLPGTGRGAVDYFARVVDSNYLKNKYFSF
ncbi:MULTISPECIES: hypothetical protein [unclassified Okeania]|nr:MULTISPECIES: hypothetical protein [unclassified Okeania]